jgi:predicted nucleotidyltransferase
MIEKLFKSEIRVRLLENFLFNPGEEFHLRDLSRRVEANPTYVKKELKNLEEIGLVTHRRKGNLLLFKPNKQAPIYEDLKKLFIKTRSLGSLLKKRIKGYDEIKYALIYGSFAQGMEKETSDVDLLVVGSISEGELHKVVMEFEEKSGREMNYILWTEKEFQKKAKEGISLLVDIVENKVIMLKGAENEFRNAVRTR